MRPGYPTKKHSKTQSLVLVLPPLALCLTWSPRRRRRAGGSRRPTGSAGPAAAPRCGSRPGPTRPYPMSSGRLGPAGGRRAAGGRRNDASRPARTAGPRPRRSRPARARPRLPWCPEPPARASAVARAAEPAQLHAQPDQVSKAATFTSPVTIGAIAASHAIASRRPVQPRPVGRAVSDAFAAVPGPPGPDPRVHWPCSAESRRAAAGRPGRCAPRP